MVTLENLIEYAIGADSRNEFCRKAQISAGNLSKIMRGQRPTPEILRKIAEGSCGRVSYEQLMAAAEYTEEAPKPKGAIPIYGSIAAGSPVEAFEDLQGSITIDYQYGSDQAAHRIALKVVGDSMDMANIPDGCIVIIDQKEQVRDGDVAAVMVNGDATVKRFYNKGSHLLLMPVSKNLIHQPQIYTEEDNISVIGKVVMALVDIN